MRIQQPVAARPAPIDRGGEPVPVVVDVGPTGPHTETSRFFYTLGAGKKGILEFLQLRVVRAQSSDTYGRAAIQVKVSHGATTYYIARCELRAGEPDAKDEVLLSGVSIPEGATVQILTYDFSGSGSCEYLARGSLLVYLG